MSVKRQYLYSMVLWFGGQSLPVDLLPSRRPAFSLFSFFFFRPDWVGLFGSEDLMTRVPGSLDPFLTPMTVVRSGADVLESLEIQFERVPSAAHIILFRERSGRPASRSPFVGEHSP